MRYAARNLHWAFVIKALQKLGCKVIIDHQGSLNKTEITIPCNLGESNHYALWSFLSGLSERVGFLKDRYLPTLCAVWRAWAMQFVTETPTR